MNGFCFNSPALISICRDGRWKKAAKEVWIEENRIFLETDKASWVKIDWAADFDPESFVMGDAWERTYGDVTFRPIGIPAFYPWYFTVKEPERIRCVGVKTGPAAFCSFRVSPVSMTLLMDVRCGCLDTLFDGRKVCLAELVSLDKQGDTFDIMHEFCRMMCENPRFAPAPVYGGDDWYAYYGNNSFDKVLQHGKMLASCAEGLENRPYQVVDAGWQPCHNWHLGEEYIGGPFQGCNRNFGSMKALADALKEIDVRPGIWIRPLQTCAYLPEEMYLRRNKTAKYIDPSHPASKELLYRDIKTLRDWGYDLIKHDFAGVDTFGRYAPNMTDSVTEGDWTFFDRSKTSAEITKEYYELTAEAAGGAFINACNTFSHLSAGIFGGFRIGDDTSGLDYSRTVKMGVNTMAARGHQHNAFYSADPDCVGITQKIPWEKNAQWLSLLSYSGMATMVSVEECCFTTQVRDAVTEAFHRASQSHAVARPIDYIDNLTPSRWLTYDGEKEFQWIL